MALHNASNVFPEIIKLRRYCRNGQVPMGIYARRIAEQINHALAYRRKMVLNQARPLVNIPLGASGSTDLWRAYVHTGYNAKQLVMRVGLAVCDNASAADPYVKMIVNPGGGPVSSTEFHYGAINTAKTATNTLPGDISWGACKVSVSPATSYDVLVQPNDYARVVSACIYEVGNNPLDDTDTGVVNPNYSIHQPILDTDIQDLIDAMRDIWSRNASHLLSWTADPQYSQSPPTFNSATATNVLDSSSTAVSASSPGYQVDLQFHNSLARSDVPVRLAVYAQRTSGAGTVANNLVRLRDSSSTLIEVTGIGNTAQWYTADGTLPADETKFDIMCATDAADTITVHAVSLLEYLA